MTSSIDQSSPTLSARRHSRGVDLIRRGMDPVPGRAPFRGLVGDAVGILTIDSGGSVAKSQQAPQGGQDWLAHGSY